MYQPAHFRVDDAAAHRALIAAHPLATLVVPTARGLEVNHLPLRLDDVTGRLIGHVARANPLWTLEPAGEAVAVFRGAEAYVTPGWYASKAEHGRVVPTWNYAVVHVHGRLRWFGADTPEDDAALLGLAGVPAGGDVGLGAAEHRHRPPDRPRGAREPAVDAGAGGR